MRIIRIIIVLAFLWVILYPFIFPKKNARDTKALAERIVRGY